MNNKKRNIIIAIALPAVLGIGIFLSIFFGSRADKIPSNPSGTVGNTAGNLNNGGLFCERDGVVYFSNSFDEDTIYRMNSDESNIEKISNVRACNLLVGGDYIYYFQLGVTGETGLGGVRTPHSYNRSKTDGSKATSLVREVVTNAQLVDNTLYLLVTAPAGPRLISINTDRTGEKEIAKYIINPASAQNGFIYYNNTVGDHYLHRFDPVSGMDSVVLEENIWYPIANGDYVYYLDLNNDYQLRRYSLSGNSIEILTKEKVQAFNVGYGYIYFQTMGDTPGLYCMNLDGSNAFLIDNGQFTDINMTSRYVYFKDYFTEGVTYHSILGSGHYETFSGAVNK